MDDEVDCNDCRADEEDLAADGRVDGTANADVDEGGDYIS